MKKLLVLAGLGGLVYWLAKDRLGGEPDEFVFTEAPPPEEPGPSAEEPMPPTEERPPADSEPPPATT